MNPHKAYDNFFYNKKNLTLFLLLIATLQILFLLFHTSKFKIPNALKNFLVSELTDQTDIKIENVFFQFPNHIEFEKVSFLDEGLKTRISIQDLIIELNTIFPTTIQDFEKIRVKTINYFSLESESNLKLNNVELLSKSDHILVDLEINYHTSSLKVKGDFKYENLKKVINFQKTENKTDIDYQIIQSHLQSLENILRNQDYSNHYISYFSIQNKLNLNINQRDLPTRPSLTQGLKFFFLYDIFQEKIEHINLHVNEILFASNKLKYNLVNFRSRSHNISLFNSSNNLINNQTSVQNIKLSGLLTGQIENFSMSVTKQQDAFEVNLFIDNNNSICSNNVIYNIKNNTFLFNGNNEFIPHLSNFQISRKKDMVKFVDGDKLSISFKSSKSPILSHYKNHVHLRANQFSVTESPPGDYEAFGYLDENVSVNLDYIYGYMGDSIVYGEFSQKWNPLNYNFKIKGYCIPSNINAWLGDWWDKIWLDFKFSKKSIPFGYFNISGIWNVKTSNKTFGAVYGKDLFYKGLPINKSLLNVIVDRNKTRISSSNSLHKFGKLSGYLSIPRNEFTSTTPMTYSISGVYPLNDGKMALGKVVEKYLNDFNVSMINIDSEGQFPISHKENKTTSQIRKEYSAHFNSSEKGSWNGIKYDEIKGTIKADSSQFDLNLPVVKMGEGLISVNLLSKFIEEMISLNVEIKNVKILDLYNSAIAYQNANGDGILTDFNASTPTDTGLIDLSLNSSGNSSDLMSFKGTGMIKLQDKQLSKVQLLGFISKGLSELPLPFPNGTLNFNKLEGLFELENGKILFDQLTLSGLLSKIVSKGHFDLKTGELDILSKIQIIGNIPIPIINQLAKLTDPFSMFAEIKITGNWQDPKWKLSINPLK